MVVINMRKFLLLSLMGTLFMSGCAANQSERLASSESQQRYTLVKKRSAVKLDESIQINGRIKKSDTKAIKHNTRLLITTNTGKYMVIVDKTYPNISVGDKVVVKGTYNGVLRADQIKIADN